MDPLLLPSMAVPEVKALPPSSPELLVVLIQQVQRSNELLGRLVEAVAPGSDVISREERQGRRLDAWLSELREATR